jgi:hypothetical protein
MAHARISLRLLVLTAACLLGATATDAATVAYYKFENGTDGTAASGKGTILDSSGNDLNGTPFGKPKYVAVGNPGSTLALRFNGSTAGVFVRDNPLLQLTHSLTLEAYVYRRNDWDGGGIVVRSDNRYDFDPYNLRVTDAGVLVFVIQQAPGTATSSVLLSPATLPVRQWVHVAGTLDDATGLQALYINGSLVASTITAIRPFGNLIKKRHAGLAIGSGIRGSPDMGYLHGSLDDIRISDVALDPSAFLPPP